MSTLMTRRVPLVALLLALVVLGTPSVPGPPARDLPPAAEVSGARFLATLGCVGCVAGGTALAMTGWGRVLVAAAKRRSTIAIFTCAGLCHRAVFAPR